MGKVLYGAFLVANVWVGLSWIAAGKDAYEIGGYLLVFGCVQVLLTLFTAFMPKKGLVVLLTAMQLFPLVLYSFGGAALGGALNCVGSLLCLILGVVSLVSARKSDCAK